MPIFFGDEHQKKFQFLLVEYFSTNIERKCQLPLDSTMFDFQVHWKGKLITRISRVSISSPMGTGVMLEILGFLGNHVLPKFIFKNNPNKHQSHMEELVVLHFLGFLLFLLFFAFLCARAGTRTQDLAHASHLLIHLPGFTEDGKKSNANWKSIQILFHAFDFVQCCSMNIERNV